MAAWPSMPSFYRDWLLNWALRVFCQRRVWPKVFPVCKAGQQTGDPYTLSRRHSAPSTSATLVLTAFRPHLILQNAQLNGTQQLTVTQSLQHADQGI